MILIFLASLMVNKGIRGAAPPPPHFVLNFFFLLETCVRWYLELCYLTIIFSLINIVIRKFIECCFCQEVVLSPQSLRPLLTS